VLAALEATVGGPEVPVLAYLHADPAVLRRRADRLAERVGGTVVPHDGRVGGGGAPGVPLPGWAVRLPEEIAAPLRAGEPPVLARLSDGACLLDLRCVPEDFDGAVAEAVLACMS
ncbi:L-seryl-tRNA(Sec) selenium transferase, partial [Tsukamurella pulmonis]